MSPRSRGLAHLLLAQGGGIRKHPDFARLESLLRRSPTLGRLRLSRVGYRLLNEPRLKIENLENFYSTYRVPRSAFFPLFLSIKWAHRRDLAAARERRAGDIAAIMELWPREVIGLARYLKEAERRANPGTPFWRRELCPHSKKRATELLGFALSDWIPYLADYIDRLRRSYRTLALADTDRLLACAFLDCLPDPATGRLPSKATVKAQYRKISKACHPDLGGDPRHFLIVTKSKDLLLEL